MSLLIDPLGRPKVTAGSDHYFRTCCLYVRPHFEARTVIATGGTVGMAEWIIDGTNVVAYISYFFISFCIHVTLPQLWELLFYENEGHSTVFTDKFFLKKK